MSKNYTEEFYQIRMMENDGITKRWYVLGNYKTLNEAEKYKNKRIRGNKFEKRDETLKIVKVVKSVSFEEMDVL